MPRLTLALAQINTRLGDVQANPEKHLGLVDEARAQGADLMRFISASPGRGLNQGDQLESARWVEQINQAYASLFTAFVAHTNRVGFEDGFNFWGGATVIDPGGQPIAHGPFHQEPLTLAEMDPGTTSPHPGPAPAPARRTDCDGSAQAEAHPRLQAAGQPILPPPTWLSPASRGRQTWLNPI